MDLTIPNADTDIHLTDLSSTSAAPIAEGVITLDNNSTGEDGTAAATRTRTRRPPGKVRYVEDTWIPLREVITPLILQTGVHLATRGNYSAAWDAFYEKLFFGSQDANGEFRPGPMSDFKLYTSNNIGVAKVKPWVIAGVDKDTEEYYKETIRKDGKPTRLQQDAFRIKSEKAAAEKAATMAAATEREGRDQRRRENEAEEEAMGLRTGLGDRGVNLPHGADGTDAVQHLSRQPNISSNRRRTVAAVSATASAATSRAAQEARIAEAAARGADTISYGVGQKTKKLRHMDDHEASDYADRSLANDTKVYNEAMQKIIDLTGSNAETPTKKRHRNYNEVCSNISLLMQERKELLCQSLSTADVDKELNILRNERSSLSSNTNLGNAFNDVA